MKFAIALCLLAFFSLGGNAQSFFKPLPKVAPKHNPFVRITTPLPDSTFTGFRPIVSAVYGYTNVSGSTLLAGTGISYEHDTYNSSTQKWYTQWSVSLQGYAGGNTAPTTVSMVTMAGVSLALFNKLLTVGFGYNFSTKSGMPFAGPGVSLNN